MRRGRDLGPDLPDLKPPSLGGGAFCRLTDLVGWAIILVTDAAYYEDLHGRLIGLLVVFDDLLESQGAQDVHHFIEVGEYGLALEEMAGALAQARTPITDQERGDMLTLAQTIKMDDDVPRALSLCPRAE